MNYEKLTDDQLKYLLKLRLVNQGANLAIKKIEIITKRDVSYKHKYFYARFLVSSDEWADTEHGIMFNTFYVNEFNFLYKALNVTV